MKQPKIVEVGGRSYRISFLDAVRQVHLARRLSPVVTANSFSAIAHALQEMSQENADYVINTCLEAVEFKQVVNNHDVWAKLQIRPGVLQIGDLEGGDVMEIVVHVARENVGSFFDRMIALVPVPEEKAST